MKNEIKNLKKAAKRIIKAVKNKERIIIYGDSDLDGVTSAIILNDAIKNLGGKAEEIYFPDRENEGYGITKEGLKRLKKHAPGLFVSLDCGIGNFKEIELANKLGFEVIIIDHHEVLGSLPKASIIVDPKQDGEKYPFKDFANVGLVFKLSEELLGEKMPDILRKDFLELTAMATISDMMPKTGENKVIIEEGIASLESSWRPGIQALLSSVDSSSSIMEKVYKINSLLNMRDADTNKPVSFKFLTLSSFEEAKERVGYLIERNNEKKEKIKEITDEVRRKVFGGNEPIIFEGNENWELILLGTAASILCQEYKKPIFLYKKQGKESQGSARAGEGHNLIEAMKTCSDQFITYGGHQKASGFKIKNTNLKEFRESMMDYFR